MQHKNSCSFNYFSISFVHRFLRRHHETVKSVVFQNSTFLHSTTAPEPGLNRALARQWVKTFQSTD